VRVIRASAGRDVYGAGGDGSTTRLRRVTRLPAPLPGHRTQLLRHGRRAVDGRRPSAGARHVHRVVVQCQQPSTLSRQVRLSSFYLSSIVYFTNIPINHIPFSLYVSFTIVRSSTIVFIFCVLSYCYGLRHVKLH